MADIGVLAVIILIIVVVGYFWGTNIMDAFNTAKQNFLQSQANNAIRTTATAGQSVCTLNVSFHPALSGTTIPAPQQIKFNGANNISWINCQSISPILASFIPNTLVLNSASPLDFLTDLGSIGATYNFNAVLVADDGTRLYPVVNPVSVHFKNILQIQDQGFDMSYTILGVPRQHYVLQITSPDIGINTVNLGNTYSQQINP